MFRVTRVSWGSSQHQARPAMAFPALAGPVHALGNQAGPCWEPYGLPPPVTFVEPVTRLIQNSLIQRLNECLVVLDVPLKGEKNIQSHVLNY